MFNLFQNFSRARTKRHTLTHQWITVNGEIGSHFKTYLGDNLYVYQIYAFKTAPTCQPPISSNIYIFTDYSLYVTFLLLLVSYPFVKTEKIPAISIQIYIYKIILLLTTLIKLSTCVEGNGKFIRPRTEFFTVA